MSKENTLIHDYKKIIKLLEYEEQARLRRGYFRLVINVKIVLLKLELGESVPPFLALFDIVFRNAPGTNPLEDFIETKIHGSFNSKQEKSIDSRQYYEYVDNSNSSAYTDKKHIIQWEEKL